MRIQIVKEVPPSAEGIFPEVGKSYEVEEVIRLQSKPNEVFLYAISVDGQVIGVSPSECKEIGD